jgi:hypothetical protein
MSGLVAYESSSDEDAAVEAVPQTPPSAKLGNDVDGESPPTSDVRLDEEQIESVPAVSSGEGLLGPLLGPSAQPNGTFAIVEEDPISPILLADMSERDAIRHLTQPTFPATSLPPSPPGSPDPAANERFRRFLELKAKGVHFNEDLARKTTFRNPSLLSTMMSKVGIDEKAQYNTSLPLDLWNPNNFPDSAYKEGLLKSQQDLQGQTDANKKMLSATGKRTIEFASETASGGSSRRSTPGQQSKRKRP